MPCRILTEDVFSELEVVEMPRLSKLQVIDILNVEFDTEEHIEVWRLLTF